MKFNLSNIPKWLWTGITLLLPLIAITVLAGCKAAPANSATPTPNFSTPPPGMSRSTPALIYWNYEQGNITEEQKILYLAYAMSNDDNLPTRYRSNVEIEASRLLTELHIIVTSPEKVCGLSSFAQSELRRLYGDTVASCDAKNSNLIIIVITALCLLTAFAIVNRKKILKFAKPL